MEGTVCGSPMQQGFPEYGNEDAEATGNIDPGDKADHRIRMGFNIRMLGDPVEEQPARVLPAALRGTRRQQTNLGLGSSRDAEAGSSAAGTTGAENGPHLKAFKPPKLRRGVLPRATIDRILAGVTSQLALQANPRASVIEYTPRVIPGLHASLLANARGRNENPPKLLLLLSIKEKFENEVQTGGYTEKWLAHIDSRDVETIEHGFTWMPNSGRSNGRKWWWMAIKRKAEDGGRSVCFTLPMRSITADGLVVERYCRDNSE
ncbi:MAG: hypothetical protein M1819_001378 [Sarea resinae]|nr:MAG: hypothetical protein M1819_001378 [Sarea resinae]